MNKTFTLNGKKIKAIDFSYNTACEMEEKGCGIENLGTNPMSTLRGYIACCMDCDLKTAGNEIGKHMASGESLDKIFEIMSEAMEDSDFFPRQDENTQTEDGASQSKAKK